jgi:AAA15 family ATPase/GTPase
MEKIEQTLIVDNFLGIKASEIETGRITALIGPQASGKSIIARLIFFFREYIEEIFRGGVISFEHKTSFDKKQRARFLEMFPSYSWEREAFEIKFSNQGYTITASSGKNSTSLHLSTSKSLTDNFRNLKFAYKKFRLNEEKEALSEKRRPRMNFLYFKRSLDSEETSVFTRFDSLFVPAARSFFAQMRKELFSILSIDKDMDPVILQFADFYEYAKHVGSPVSSHRRGIVNRYEEFFRDIIKGSFYQDDDIDWIRMKDRKIEIRKASSGQQEALPLLVSLAAYPEMSQNGLMFVEEPEAHLFPSAQKRVMDFFIQQLRNHHFSLFFTTHSPYLVSCLNNQILRNKWRSDEGLPFDDVRAYYLDEDGTKDLRIFDMGIIDAAALDEVSSEIAEEFDEIIEKIDE